jgi:hypothetical protein
VEASIIHVQNVVLIILKLPEDVLPVERLFNNKEFLSVDHVEVSLPQEQPFVLNVVLSKM